jgi:hypothetical protein
MKNTLSISTLYTYLLLIAATFAQTKLQKTIGIEVAFNNNKSSSKT